MKLFSRILKDCLTNGNGEDYCFVKNATFAALCVYFPMAGYMLHKSPDHFSLSEFAIGFGTIVGAAAASVKIKNGTEPE